MKPGKLPLSARSKADQGACLQRCSASISRQNHILRRQDKKRASIQRIKGSKGQRTFCPFDPLTFFVESLVKMKGFAGMTKLLNDILKQPQELIRAIHTLLEKERPRLDRAASILNQAKSVYFTGIGASWHAA